MNLIKKYPSGLTLIASKMDSVYSVAVGVFVNVGSVFEDETNNGISHFLEHLHFKGTENRSAKQISEEIEDIGAVINAATAKDKTFYYTKSLSTDIEKCINILSDMYFNANIPQEELDRERNVVLEEIKMAEDSPEDVSGDAIYEAMFKGQPLGQTILGNPEIIKYYDRNSILNFKKLHYIPSNTVLSVCGQFDFNALDDLINKYFESNFNPVSSLPQQYPVSNYTNNYVTVNRKIKQAHIEFAWKTFEFSSNRRQALSMLTDIFGGGMSSRLFQTIREKHGLVYSVYSSTSFYKHNGFFDIYAGLSPNNVKLATQLIQSEIDLLLDKGVTEAEFNRAKVAAKTHCYYSVENMSAMMSFNALFYIYNGYVPSMEQQIAEIDSISIDDLNNLARDIFANSNVVDGTGCARSYVGPKCK